MYDQKIKKDAGKLQLHLVPTEIIEAIARARMYGVEKYGDNEAWKQVEKERYIDAAFRHFIAYLNGVEKDEESGLSPLDHLACNIAFLIALEESNG